MTEDHSQHDAVTMERILHNVKTYGCHLALVDANDYLTGFAYSIGLFKTFGHPDLICFGLHPDVMGAILNHACNSIRKGETFQPGQEYQEFLEGYSVQFVPVDKEYYASYLGYATWFYDRTFDFPVLQLVWPDKQHHYPWDEGFNPAWKFKQPLLDRNTDFKFYEERNLAVYTTRQAFEGLPILYVYHNADGDWQFHTSDQPDIADGMLVCLEEITRLDPSINDIYHLQYGWQAWRQTPSDPWEYAEDK